MDVKFDKWTHNNMTVLASDDATPLYSIKCHTLKFKLEFISALNDATLAWTDLHCYKSSFEVEFVGHPALNVHSDKFWKIQRSYDSPAFQQKITWKSQSGWSKIDYVCLDEHAIPVARFVSSNKWKKAGSIEIAEGYNLTDAQRDEVVVVGVSLAWQVMQNIVAATSASGGSSAAAIGA